MSRSKRPVSGASRGARKRAPEKKKNNSAKSAIYIIVLIIAVAGLGWYFFQEFGFRTNYNTTINELEDGFKASDKKLIEKSMKSLESMYKSNKGTPERAEPIKEHLIKCYRHFAADLGSPLKTQVSYIKKIEEVDPKALRADEKKLLKIGE